MRKSISMYKYYFILPFLVLNVNCFGQLSKETTILNKNCSIAGNLPYIVDELKTSEKDVSDHLILKSKNRPLKTAIEFDLVFQPNAKPCCRRIVIIDQIQISKKQRDALLIDLLSYPEFENIKVDKPKQLIIFIVPDMKFRPICNFVYKSK